MMQHEAIKSLFIENIKQKDTENVVLANLIVLTTLLLTLLIPVGKSFFAVLLFLYFKLGLVGFVFEQKVCNVVRYKKLFVPIKNAWKAVRLFVIKLFLFLFWSTCFIVPGIVCLLDYSFSSLIIYECPDLDIKGVLMLSKELSRGFRKTIALSFLFAVFFLIVCTLIIFFAILLFDVWLTIPSCYYVFFIVFAGVFSFVVFGLPTIQLEIVESYIFSKQSKRRVLK